MLAGKVLSVQARMSVVMLGSYFEEFYNQPRLTYPCKDLVRTVDLSSRLLETYLNDNFYKDSAFAFVSVSMNQYISFEWLSQH